MIRSSPNTPGPARSPAQRHIHAGLDQRSILAIGTPAAVNASPRKSLRRCRRRISQRMAPAHRRARGRGRAAQRERARCAQAQGGVAHAGILSSRAQRRRAAPLVDPSGSQIHIGRADERLDGRHRRVDAIAQVPEDLGRARGSPPSAHPRTRRTPPDATRAAHARCEPRPGAGPAGPIARRHTAPDGSCRWIPRHCRHRSGSGCSRPARRRASAATGAHRSRAGSRRSND